MRFCSQLLLLYPRNPNPRTFSHRRRWLVSSRSDHCRRFIPADLRARGDKPTVSIFASRFSPFRAMQSSSSSSVAKETSMANDMWSEARDVAALATYSPLVVNLKANTLQKYDFRIFIAQEFYCLNAFADAFKLALVHADDDVKDTLCRLRNGILENIVKHDSNVRVWGIGSIQGIPLHPSTKKYTEFLLATASGKINVGKGAGKIVTPFEKTKLAAYTVGSVLSFVRLYSFLGKEVQSFLPYDANSNLYKAWIDSYSSDDFEDAIVRFEELLDKLIVTFTGDELEIIKKLYMQATKLEVDFFLAQSIMQPSIVPIVRLHDPANRLVIFSDFDLTCTVRDTSANLAELAIQTRASAKAEQSDTENLDVSISPSDLKDSFAAVSEQYTEEYRKSIDAVLQLRRASKFDYDGLCEGLKQHSVFEKRANSRVVESGVLRGVTLDSIRKAGDALPLLDGCSSFFQKIVEKKQALNIEIHLVSHSWCGDLIRSTFQSAGSSISIHSNEFEFEGSVSTGRISRTMETAFDKLKIFKTILSTHPKHLSVFIGDSVGDLLCLLEADIGIVIGSNQNLRNLGTHFGVSFVPLLSGLIDKQRQLSEGTCYEWKGMSGVLYTVTSWPEIQAFILGEVQF